MKDRAMPNGLGEQYDFFLSRRGSVAAIAREVADVLTEKGYKVLTQDYDIPVGASFIGAMHEAIKNSRDLIVLFTRDYEQSPYTRKEFTSFEAERAQSAEERHIIVLRCEDVPVRGLLADNVYQDLVGVADTGERRRRIIAAAECQSQAAPPPPRPFIGVPPRIASFTGRAEELDRLDAILMHDKAAAVTQAVGRAAVQGMGGVGKTSLAIEYAHRYRRLYAGVCWCPAETRAGLLSALATLGVTLGAVAPDEADVEKASKTALRRLNEQRATWLLIYDNVNEPEQVADLLPSGGARVLITSRFSDWSELADEVALDVLPLEQAVVLLESRAGRSDASGARTLAEALGHLPLALDHAAAYCKRTQVRFSDYTAKASSLIATVPQGAGYPKSVAATFDLAIAQAVSQRAASEALMAFLAQCAPERIPMLLVDGAIEDEGERLQALVALAEVSLVKHDPFEDETEAVTVHRLVQMVALARSEAKGMARAAADLVIARLMAIYPGDGYSNPSSWHLCTQLMPHLFLQQAAGLDEHPKTAPDLLNRAGNYFHGRAVYPQAALLLREALSIREKQLGLDHPDTAQSLNNLAGLLRAQGDDAGARPLFERALAIREKVLGPEDHQTATSLNNLADLLRFQGDLAGARPVCERALAIREKVLGPEHPDTAISLSNLASLLQAQGDLAGAQPLYGRALAILEKALNSEHPNTNRGRRDLAVLLLASGEAADAFALGKTALAAHDKVLGPGHRWTKDSARVTADALDVLGRTEEAKALRGRYGLAVAQDNPKPS
jgi:tetratricopeptide (TPR) repeat protein